MDNRAVLDRYYELANAGEWDRWCDLFAADTVLDEQLAGRVEGREVLREMMTGFTSMYARFRNTPLHVVVDGDQAAVVSRIEAVSASGKPVDAGVVNYFRFRGGEIAYMANYHDTVPFQVITQV
ncbi:nuclear transport factor 2 family protein [Actinomadura fibrosa]|uniref:Nuclear transport factor 2 family protein n=1 Tax=Actinomadura fibrosa TaxID=111802 RepID=A0ABW2XUP7_9ACTN|nr:nuclear transport factor 2 family protein [Actinomadura fibrosa]